ncbi:MAG: hypothetical protein Unbinned1473contig1000_51 [Prokaryotic dsDNA virus sp.]|nr:MAG: hypothetical protein Unbinned1473contig1000_51 [Prokaryotic dsDNA virus sp.]|tara:strand:+ start:8007 stop:8468 length:462 start_codon:yes stop_codon:yes gene_type:complete
MTLPWRREPKEDILKYWKVVKAFVKAKYEITETDLDILLFLNSEGYFSRQDFREFEEMFAWDESRFNKMKDKGWIEVFRERGKKHGARYTLSYKARRMIVSVYDKLNGKPFPEHPSVNPMFKNNVPYMHKVYRNYMKKINKETKELRQRHAQK